MVNPKEQLRIDKQGQIMIFTDKETGKKWHSQMSWMRALIYGTRNYYYAGKYIPRPEGNPHPMGRPKGAKNKIITPLLKS